MLPLAVEAIEDVLRNGKPSERLRAAEHLLSGVQAYSDALEGQALADLQFCMEERARLNEYFDDRSEPDTTGHDEAA